MFVFIFTSWSCNLLKYKLISVNTTLYYFINIKSSLSNIIKEWCGAHVTLSFKDKRVCLQEHDNFVVDFSILGKLQNSIHFLILTFY